MTSLPPGDLPGSMYPFRRKLLRTIGAQERQGVCPFDSRSSGTGTFSIVSSPVRRIRRLGYGPFPLLEPSKAPCRQIGATVDFGYLELADASILAELPCIRSRLFIRRTVVDENACEAAAILRTAETKTKRKRNESA